MSSTFPQTTEETLLFGHISANHLVQQHVRPPQLRDGDFIATLTISSPGAPSYVIGRRVSGKAYDRIIMSYGPDATPWQRIWQLSADRGTEVDYQVIDETSSTGFASVER